jgi:hypothetical protein
MSNRGSYSVTLIYFIFKETNVQMSHVSEGHKANGRELMKCIPVACHYSFHGSRAYSGPKSAKC